MPEIRYSVGRGGRNEDADVIIFQQLLNANLHRFQLPDPLREDGLVKTKTIEAIKKFQEAIGFKSPDGRVDPGGRTPRELNTDPRPELLEPAPPTIETTPAQDLCFPFEHRPTLSYTAGSGAFGSSRWGGRRHAGCDLYAETGTTLRAMADGVVIRGPYLFYDGTYAIEIDHTGDKKSLT